MAENIDDARPLMTVWRRFRRNRLAFTGFLGVAALVLIALYAPLLANGRPLVLWRDGVLSFPFARFLFSPDSPERLVETLFNYLMLFLPTAALLAMIVRKKRPRFLCLAALAIAWMVPFLCVRPMLDKRDWRKETETLKGGDFVLFAPVRFGPFETVGKPFEEPSFTRFLGSDQIGRDILSRIIYGARVAIAIGFLSSILSLTIGVAIGLFSGYFGGWRDLLIMRLVEIVICFPSFLLLLILMAVLMDRKIEQSALVVIPVIGFLGWTGVARVVRGETLKQRAMPYAMACESAGLPVWRILFVHLLPNVSGPIFVSAVFMVAANVLAESGLSFLGFGVQPPTASWGELSRQAFSDPMRYWVLTLCPGLLIFITVSSFNLVGEGLRKALCAHSE